MRPDPLLAVEDLCVEFWTRRGTVHAVNGISFEIAPGETLGIVGESGCGKSVTSLALLGILPRAGRVVGGTATFGDRDLLKLSDDQLRRVRGRDIAMIFQDPMTSLNPVLTIGRQIREALETHFDMDKGAAQRRAAELLDQVGIPSAKARIRDYPHQFSGGMRQRAMIAMALVHNPSVLIADEPTTALDVTVQAQILELIERVKREFDIGVILITHDLGVISETAQTVLVMYAGREMEYGPASELFQKPQNPYTWGLLGSMPTIERRLERLVAIEGSPPSMVALPEGCSFHPRCPYRFAPCTVELPELLAVPDGHLDRCHLEPDRKREIWADIVASRLGATG
jgi:peptide/nickel transport system ATP-binding protein